MTFEEWYGEQDFNTSNPEVFARLAWQAATLAERDACLRAIDDIEDCGCGVPCDCIGISDSKFAIRARGDG